MCSDLLACSYYALMNDINRLWLQAPLPPWAYHRISFLHHTLGVFEIMVTKSEPASPCLESSVPLHRPRRHTAPNIPEPTTLPVSRAYWDPVREDGHTPSRPAPGLETPSTSVEPRTHLTPAELFSATLPSKERIMNDFLLGSFRTIDLHHQWT